MNKIICWWCGYCAWLGADRYECLRDRSQVDAAQPGCQFFTLRFDRKGK